MNKTVLLILDGFGLSEIVEGNAIRLANTPNINEMFMRYPWTSLGASGLEVGLPPGQMGNSEVGHLNIGAGRVVYQELTRITKSIVDGDFFINPAFLSAINNCKHNNSTLHLYGLLSDGGVHSHIEHLFALLELAKRYAIEKVCVHAFLDGRDTSPMSGRSFLIALQNKINELGVGEIASVMGRYYAMDRDKRWERVQLAYDVLTAAKGNHFANVLECIDASYANGATDEFVVPASITGATIKDNDSVIFFNFRPDRAREITKMICDNHKLTYVCFTEYDLAIKNKLVAYAPQNLTNTLGEYISKLNLTQLRLAETEKYAHVTFFFNGGVETPNANEQRILIPSAKVATYDLQPEMSVFEVTEQLISHANDFDLTICNFANADMVGHTGKLDAAIKAIEAIDECLGKVIEFVLQSNIQLIICADHGNSDKMIDEQHQPFTAHSTNPVPFVLINCGERKLKTGGRLCDIAPTLLELMKLQKPSEMTGVSLIKYEEDVK